MNFLKLTNKSKGFEGQKVVINMEAVVSMFRTQVEREEGVFEDVTFVHCPPHGTWEVEETLDEILSKV